MLAQNLQIYTIYQFIFPTKELVEIKECSCLFIFYLKITTTHQRNAAETLESTGLHFISNNPFGRFLE